MGFIMSVDIVLSLLFQEQEGNKRVFACKYHGWSYGLDGKLAKAPKYDELEGFERGGEWVVEGAC